jgi:hypothetical protein
VARSGWSVSSEIRWSLSRGIGGQFAPKSCGQYQRILQPQQRSGRAFEILEKNLNLLGDMKYVYTQADTMQKREFISMVFDNNFYYQEGIYRTPTMMDMFSHNSFQMKEKRVSDL